MTEAKAQSSRHGSSLFPGVLCRMLGSLTGGIILFALWLIAVLARMPRPPSPPSFALTLTAPLVTAAGFALGMLVVERIMQRRKSSLRGTFLWALAGCTAGTLGMFPFGGMLVGFGMFGMGTLVLLVREVLFFRKAGRGTTGG